MREVAVSGTFLLFCLLGVCGALAGARSGLAAGSLLGSIAFTALGNWIGLPGTELPPLYVTSLQALAGCLVGASITREALAGIRKLLLPVLVNAVMVMGACAFLTWLFVQYFGWSGKSAWLAVAPARMQEMIIFASSIGADAQSVAVTQIVRLVAVIAVTPLLLRLADRRRTARVTANGPTPRPASPLPVSPPPPATVRGKAGATIKVLLCGGVGGYLGGLTHIPCGILLGSMLFVGGANLIGLGVTYLPKKISFLLQVMAGILLGLQVTPESIGAIGGILPIVLINTTTLIGISIFSAFTLRTVFGWDPALSWLAAAPARLSDMLIIGAGMNAPCENIVAVHLLRILLVTALTPILLIYL